MKLNNEHLEDWRRGNDSTLLPLVRITFMNEWLKNNKREILTIEDKVEEKTSIGFENLPMYEKYE